MAGDFTEGGERRAPALNKFTVWWRMDGQFAEHKKKPPRLVKLPWHLYHSLEESYHSFPIISI